MPKQKSHSGAKKRFKRSGTGKLLRNQANLGHIMEKKSSRRVRRLQGQTGVSQADTPNIRKLLNI